MRSWRRGALAQPRRRERHQREERKRVGSPSRCAWATALVLVGHGIPFWLASTIYVAVSILVFQRLSRDPVERRLTPGMGQGAGHRAAASIVTWLVFERVFLVRLP